MKNSKTGLTIVRAQLAMSLVELLVAMAIFSGIILLLFSILGTSQTAWGNARDQLRQFQESRVAFEIMSRRITDAVLNPYWGYEFPGGDTSQSPLGFTRQSELHFVSGPAASGSAGGSIPGHSVPGHAIFFHGPFGVHDQTDWSEFSTLINGWGYYVDYGVDSKGLPSFFPNGTSTRPPRFRLMELRIPSDELTTYEQGETNPNKWYQEGIANQRTTVVAENVIALIISPRAPEGTLTDPTKIAPNYLYDTRGYLNSSSGNYATDRSRHQLAPLLQITMVVIDETSAIRLDDQAEGTTPPDFGVNTLFQDASNYEADIAMLEENLIDAGIRYRIFSTVIRLRNARWSETPPQP